MKIYYMDSFLRSQYQRPRSKRGLISPNKFMSRSFLKYLRENHYIAKSGFEYVPSEVDEMYFQKCDDIASRELDQLYKLQWDNLSNEQTATNY